MKKTTEIFYLKKRHQTSVLVLLYIVQVCKLYAVENHKLANTLNP